MPGAMVKIILDKIYNKTVPKPINLRPGYDMEHVFNGPQTDEYRYEKVVEIEKQYDYLSIIRPHETPQQWADRIRGSLQELLSKREYSVYHVYCLFASFGQLKSKTFYVNGELFEDHFRYRRPSVHKSQMAICFKCWKLVKITEVEPRKVYYSGWGRWAYEVESEDLMKNHWNYSCFKAKTATIAKNTMSSASNFEPTCISPTSYHSSGPSQRCSEPGSQVNQPNFNEHYKNLLDQLPPSMKKDVWLRLTNCKNRPLSEEQLEEHELCVQQRENNIKKTIDAQVAEERKRLKDEYDALKYRLESEYNNCMVDMKQKTYSFKHQLESQHNSRLAELEKQYKSHISALDKANAVKDKEIGKLSSTISQLKNEKRDIKKTADSVCKDLEDIIFTKDLKIIALNDRVIFSNPSAERDGTIEPNTFISFHDAEYWTRKREDAKSNLNIRKKYTFRKPV
ncbi:hypothetical protein RhiirA1_491302 [Rhizophagus irregularis]|uniref:Uncharacterized protein n=2 Tax=Rhizophagus irregularis TaxID=588596 RepID=A0A2N0SAE1_9GLOM|nr:hypothetical protein RhiirA1_491302 [Rhizophagus irregularis]